MEETSSAQHKALSINLDAQKFGVFAEIGAGQEVVRWFFHSGKASATVAKSISAYNMAVSDDLYGPTAHYVSRERLESMLDCEYTPLLNRLDQARGDKTAFFVFADTAATHSPHHAGGHGWLGVRFQTQPRSAPSQIVAHVQLLDPAAAGEQEALGVLGVNLLYGAFSSHQDPGSLLGSLLDGLRPGRVEVDMIKFSGPAFAGVDNRLMSLQLVEQGLTDAAMFTAQGAVVQGSEVLSGKPVVIERGAFRPVTNVMQEMLDGALSQYRNGPGAEAGEPIVLMEMTLSNLMTEHAIDHADFLARVDMLNALGRMVMISNYTRFDGVTNYLRKYTPNWIVMVMGAPTLNEIFDEKYYTDLDGGILEGLGRLFQGNVKLYSYPMKTSESGVVVDVGTLEVAPESQRLYRYLLEMGRIEPILQFDEEQLQVYPREVLAKIQAGLPGWETMVPGPVAQLIKDRKLFGYAGGIV
jgi:hypothetical protein